MHRYFYDKDRVFVILSAGNLATSQAVMSEVQRDLEQDEKSKMLTTSYVSDIAEYLGGLLLKTKKKYEFSVEQTTLIDAGATLIFRWPDSRPQTGVVYDLSGRQFYYSSRNPSLSSNR